MKSVGVFVNFGKQYKPTLEIIRNFCRERSIKCLVEYSDKNFDKTVIDYSKIETVIVLGGDGTILSVARSSAKYDVKIVSINIGRLGFLSSCESNETYERLIQYYSGDYYIENRIMLTTKILQDDKTIFESLAMNDVFISKKGIARTIDVDVYIDDIAVNKIVADGILISTPTGSTAYSLSAGGPIINPQVDAILMSPVCAHSLSARCMVLPSTSTIKTKTNTHDNDLYISIDGQINKPFVSDNDIKISVSKYKSHFVRFEKDYFYPRLKTKLIDWSI
jgi:NAD+ kinase